MFKNLTGFQKRMFIGVVLALLINFGIIAVLVTALNVSEGRLQAIGDTMEEMATLHIVTEVTVDEPIPVETDIFISEELEMSIKMFVESEIPFRAEIPVNENMLIPFKIGVKDYITLDTTITVTDYVDILVDDTIPLDQ